MKFVLTLLLTTSLQAIAINGVSQSRINMEVKNTSIAAILDKIQNRYEYRFFYTDELGLGSRKVNLLAKEATIDYVMDQLLNLTGYSYKKINKGLVVIIGQPGVLADFKVTGKVTDANGDPLVGVSVIEKGTTNGTSTSADGSFSLSVKDGGATLILSNVGYQDVEIAVDAIKNVAIVMQALDNKLENVAIVAYGTQKKSSLVSSVTVVDPKELKGPTSNLTTMLAGKIPGIISYQRSGAPGEDNAQFFIRGVGTFGAGKIDPLILIDGVETDATGLARLQPDDISGFSVLKDATASALYGARGANGVILIATKTGQAGKFKFNVRVENSLSSNTRNFKLADNITYMNLANEAVYTRNPLGILPYAQTKIDMTAAGANPLLYPNNNWMKELINDYTDNQRYNVNVSGGTEKARYYLSATYNIDNGVFKVDRLSNFNSNAKMRSYSVLSNINLKLTSKTDIAVNLKGQFDNRNTPAGGSGGVFSNMVTVNPVAFPAIYPASYLPYAKHPLFGNALVGGTGTTLYENPYANLVSGYAQTTANTILAQFNINQKLDFITPGLSARGMAYTSRYSTFSVNRSYSPFFYTAYSYDGRNINNLILLNDASSGGTLIGKAPTEYLSFSSSTPSVTSTTYAEAALNYSRTFNKDHYVSGMLIGILKNSLTSNASDLQASLPFRNMGVSGRATYGYKNRYFGEFNFGWNGSERFALNHRYGFFPSFGVGWTVSEENFFEPLKNVVSNLKLRATHGWVGNDQIGNASDRFFYLSNVNMNAGSTNFGTDFNFSLPTVAISRYANNDITWEQSEQTNLGLDLKLLENISVTIDAYRQLRSNILMVRNTVPTTDGLAADISANVGKASSEGIDFSADYKKTFSRSWWVQTRGTLTFARSKVLVNEEPVYPAALAYLSKAGRSIGQAYGLFAERLFIDQNEVNNSPLQTYGQYAAGDIKYRDINNDGMISDRDIIPIGWPTTPEIIYGFGFSLGYKQFDFNAFFQGSARSSFFINPTAISPFIQSGGNQNGLLDVIAKDYWSENNRNSYAFWPRLNSTLTDPSNNTRQSTWWMRDGSFLRLKTVELGYNMPAALLTRLHLTALRAYLNSSNIFSISKFKLWDIEMAGNGLGYPLQRVLNFGINIGF
ncbi:SusC/RagA family TonB-linked outer membrane protein [Niabella drilacis]|nr:SusC/RagA family TonB-linked outer membrane protein [Niabella drilacis]